MTRVSTILARDLELQECTDKMDSMCKKILSNKIILAWIIKSVVKEYAGYGVAEIASELIEGTPKISEVLLHRDEVYVDERIVGENTEDITVTEGKATFDIYFTAIVPDDFNNNSEWTKLYMNVEPQDEFYIGYPIIKRGVYYGCRMISSQYEKEFKNSEYGKIKKVYSIWICTDPPKYRQNSIERYFIGEEKIVGDIEEEKESYDLINVIMICIGTDEDTYNNTDNKLLRLLNVLFFDGITVEDKKYILENEFNIPMTVELEREVQDMGDYGAGVLRRGFEKGMKEGMKEGLEQGRQKTIFEMVKKNKLTVEEACEELKITREIFIEKLELYNVSNV